MLGSSMGMGMVPNSTLMSGGRVRKKFQMTDITISNNFSFLKYAEKSFPGLSEVGVLHGEVDGPRTLTPGSRSKMCTYHVD